MFIARSQPNLQKSCWALIVIVFTKNELFCIQITLGCHQFTGAKRGQLLQTLRSMFSYGRTDSWHNVKILASWQHSGQDSDRSSHVIQYGKCRIAIQALPTLLISHIVTQQVLHSQPLLTNFNQIGFRFRFLLVFLNSRVH